MARHLRFLMQNVVRVNRQLSLCNTNRPMVAPINRYCSSDADKNSDLVLTEKKDNILLIGINRPEVRNCVNKETARLLKNAFRAFDKDHGAKVAILYGKGPSFCAGLDLKELSQYKDLKLPFGPMGPTVLEPKKPVIAAINGYAVAGGLELAILCDLRVAEKSAVMGMFCRRFGVPLIDGGSIRLPKLIGISRALDMILTGRPVGAEEALQFGLVNRIVPDGQGLEKSIELAKEIASFPEMCMLADRRSAIYNTYTRNSFDDSLEYETENAKDVLSEESIKGATRFTKGQGKHGSFDNLDKDKGT
ncbi:probable enoyl-CoA hydratase [Amphiura filiformis]|uniref:probable enoyl-CoA hydratase n=1 Tax=Amphiura filiformis TaxID=82378 RepID=UPI003B20F527